MIVLKHDMILRLFYWNSTETSPLRLQHLLCLYCHIAQNLTYPLGKHFLNVHFRDLIFWAKCYADKKKRPLQGQAKVVVMGLTEEDAEGTISF